MRRVGVDLQITGQHEAVREGRYFPLLLQPVYLLEHVDHARDEAVAEAHVFGHDEKLVDAFAQERGDRQLLGHVGVVAHVLAGVLDGKFGGGVIIGQRNLDQALEHDGHGTAGHDDIAERLHLDARLAGDGDGFGGDGGMTNGDELLSSFN